MLTVMRSAEVVAVRAARRAVMELRRIVDEGQGWDGMCLEVCGFGFVSCL
jgi:hypothetical protein